MYSLGDYVTDDPLPSSQQLPSSPGAEEEQTDKLVEDLVQVHSLGLYNFSQPHVNQQEKSSLKSLLKGSTHRLMRTK